MGDGPRISFLTTAYQTEKVVAETIDSVLAQTIQDWELIVVDNGRSDDMAAVVERYTSDDRIKLIRQDNRGYVGGVMAASEAARGRYITVLDSDDIVMPRFADKVTALLDAHPEVAAVTIDAYRIDDEGVLPTSFLRSIGVKRKPNPSRPLTLTALAGGFVPYYCGAVRREIWDEVGGYETDVDGVEADVLFWARVVSHHDVRVIPEQLACYRLRSDSLSRHPELEDAFQERLEKSFLELGNISDDSTRATEAALESNLRQLRYLRSIAHARQALLDADDVTARRGAREEWAQRKTLRGALILVLVTLSPGTLRRVHPVKQRVTHSWNRIFRKLTNRFPTAPQQVLSANTDPPSVDR